MKVRRDPETVHPPLAAYAHQIEVSGERLLVMSGQIGAGLDGSVPAGALDQLAAALENVRRNLDAAGMGLGDLVKLTIYLVGEVDTVARRALVERWLGPERPCMTVVYVSALASPALKVEVDAWAAAS